MPSGLNSYRVLVVDDTPAIHEDFRKVLASRAAATAAVDDLESALFGDAPAAAPPMYDLDFASQGDEALAKVKAAADAGRPYAMIFCDMRMPPGWTGTRTLREIWHVCPDLQAAICTAYSDYSPEEISADLGVKGRMVILRKPFDPTEIRQLAAMVCEKWELARQRKSLQNQVAAAPTLPPAGRPPAEAELARAIAEGQVRPFYQPILTTADQSLVGFEALARWVHPTRGLILPQDFIPLAESSGLIVPLGLTVLEESCRQLVRWQRSDPRLAELAMSVNVSRRQLVTREIVQQVAQIIRRTGVAAGLLKLEITETAFMENADTAVDVLNRLRGLGVQLHLDDFGTGYSSLSCLHSFPLSGLKVDRSFVKDLPTGMPGIGAIGDGRSGKFGNTVLGAITTMAKALDMPLVAEGVETNTQFVRLRAMGCDYVQGYLFGRPMDAATATDFIRGVNAAVRLAA